MMERFEKEENIISDGISVIERKFGAGSATAVHCHDFIELEYISEGRGKNIIDGKEYEFFGNTLFFTTPINFHSLVFYEDTRLVNITLSETICNPHALFRIASSHAENAVVFSDSDSVFIKKLIGELSAAVGEKNKEYLSALLDTLLFKTAKSIKQRNTLSVTYVQSAMLYIMNNFRYDITLASAADFVGLAPAYLSLIFKKSAGVNFKEYLSSLRFDYAKQLLRNSDMSISEVCYESGFSDYSNFLRSFKKRFGISPGSLRKECKNRS